MPNRTKPVAFIVMALVLLVVLDGCASSSRSRRARSVQGRGSPDPVEQSRYVGETLGFSEEESRCIVDKMRDAGIPLSEIEAATDQYFVPMLQIMRDCIDPQSGSVPASAGSAPPGSADPGATTSVVPAAAGTLPPPPSPPQAASP